MNKILSFLVTVEAIAIVFLSLALMYKAKVEEIRAERVELLEDYKATCDEFVKLSNKNTRTETNLRVGYARLVERVFERLGISGCYVPGANGEILKALLLEVRSDEKDGNSEEISGYLRASMGGK